MASLHCPPTSLCPVILQSLTVRASLPWPDFRCWELPQDGTAGPLRARKARSTPRRTGTRCPLLASVSLLPKESLDCQVSLTEGKKQKQNHSTNASRTILNPGENDLEPSSFQIWDVAFIAFFKRALGKELGRGGACELLFSDIGFPGRRWCFPTPESPSSNPPLKGPDPANHLRLLVTHSLPQPPCQGCRHTEPNPAGPPSVSR